MIGARGRWFFLMFCGLASLAAGGCADMELPSWVPFQGPTSDQVPGVVAPRERIEKLKKLAEASGSATPEQRQQVSEQLAASIKTEKDALMRLEIIRTLGRYPGPAADAILKAALNDSESRVRIAACEAWGKRHDDQAVALLGETLRSDVDADVRMAAATALGATKNPKASEPLGEALSDRDPAMQYRAVVSLEQATGKDLGGNIQRWQQYVKGELPADQTPSMAERFRKVF
jgi:HEAT repeat protein